MAAAKNGNIEHVEIPAFVEKVIPITIVGTSPLIVHNFDEKSKRQMLDAMQHKPVPGKKSRPPRIPVNDYMRSLYWLTEQPEDGANDEEAEKNYNNAMKKGARFGFPANGIKLSFISGGFRAGFSKNKVSVYGAFFVNGNTEHSTFELAEIIGSEPWMREDVVRLQGTTADLRYRAQFDEWRIPLTLTYYPTTCQYSLDQILTFISISGATTGLGEWRVEKSGRFGMYRLEV